MSKPVAVDGNIEFETSSEKHDSDSNKSGSWKLIESGVTLGSILTVQGKLVAIEAFAKWQYIGGTTGSPPTSVPPVDDSATLSPTATVLTDNGDHLLLDNDQQSGQEEGNKIVAVASQSILKTD